MKIAIWWQQESWGGVDTHLALLLAAWPAADTFTIFHNTSNPGVQRIASALAGRSVKLVAFRDWQRPGIGAALRIFQHFALPLRFAGAARDARRLLETHGPFDALLADNGSYPGAWTCLAALKAAAAAGVGKRMLLVHHAAGTYGMARRLAESSIDRGVQRWATDIVAVSRATRDTIIRLRHFNTELNPIRVIHNGVSFHDAPPAMDTALRARWQASPDDFVVGMLGRIERYKGHEDLLLAIAELPEALRSRLKAVFVGGGEETEKARLAAIADRLGLSGRVLFAGYMPEPPSVIVAQFDCLAMVTKDFEGFGLSAAEAMSAGTPLLATAVGGVPEFVTPDTALLVPPESPEDIARALAAIISDPGAARTRAAAARSQIANFSDAVMANRFHRLLTL